MVIKDAQLGEVKGVTLIKLGNGDVQIAACRGEDKSYVGVQFMNDTPREIGTKHNTCGVSSDDSRPEAMIQFTNIESIEVLEKALAKAKVTLRNIDK